MKKTGLLIILTTIASIGFAQRWDLQWSDEFNGTKLDKKIWSMETGNGEYGWGCGQKDYSTDRKDNVEVSNGTLKLRLLLEDFDNFKYTSGRINTKNKFYAKYGKIEARLKIPGGKGIGSSFWMLPQFDKYKGWPKSGEIDIMETNGDKMHINYGTVHYQQWDSHQFYGNSVTIPYGSLVTDFHRYGIVWNEKSITWYVDDNEYSHFDIETPIDERKPFNEEFYVILSTGVGSDFSGKIIDEHLLPQTLEVDYLRVYKGFYNPLLESSKTAEDGKTILLSFTEKMKNPENKFEGLTITKNNGDIVPINGISLDEKSSMKLIVSLENAITKQDSNLLISYKQGGLISTDTMPLEKLLPSRILNMVTGAAPIIVGTKVTDEFSIFVELNKPIDAQVKIDPKEFSVIINGKPSIITAVSVQNNILKLIPETPIFNKEEASIIYNGVTLTSHDNGKLKSQSIKLINNVKKRYLIPGKLEAESYFDMKGVHTEVCRDFDEGKNVGFIDTDDWMDYLIQVQEDGDYEASLRYSCYEVGSKIDIIDTKTNTKLGNFEIIKATGDWQRWNSVKKIFPLKKGFYTIRIFAREGGFNMNYINFKKAE